MCVEPVLHKKRTHCNEKLTHTRRSSHHPLQLEKAKPKKKKKTSELKEWGRIKVLKTRASALDVTLAHGCYCLKSKRRQEGEKEVVSLP